ncbi:YALI0F11715p [Yarrowia lipolytica CLIB122]|uniref:YALI0F11715p n=1 Tax=Yarrowia lipolytica (strain CLIB 122 / E 150) TaxID=284591 RepID=Q6C213_YARLI|nr:YALI0F11715p [Yarrowia lipolytica CLIB122]RMI97895.1 hypothetical protein BD777DRAFT_141750 [Yarrowia lipolytica]CAG78106.2 YALI0F11715p [Yarrowia lipolytica CLIB122]|eukprot:XP_505299.2 YALI0F11715p [Yarrowia lipolytica CLIB122]
MLQNMSEPTKTMRVSPRITEPDKQNNVESLEPVPTDPGQELSAFPLSPSRTGTRVSSSQYV